MFLWEDASDMKKPTAKKKPREWFHCDRCGKWLTEQVYVQSVDKLLCPECFATFDEWITEETTRG